MVQVPPPTFDHISKQPHPKTRSWPAFRNSATATALLYPSFIFAAQIYDPSHSLAQKRGPLSVSRLIYRTDLSVDGRLNRSTSLASHLSIASPTPTNPFVEREQHIPRSVFIYRPLRGCKSVATQTKHHCYPCGSSVKWRKRDSGSFATLNLPNTYSRPSSESATSTLLLYPAPRIH